MVIRLALTGIIICIATLSALGQSEVDPLDCWPQWRGPLATGVAPNGDPPVEWDATTNVAWKREIPGRSSSTPVVWGNRLFLLTAIETDRAATDDQSQPESKPQGRGRRRSAAPRNVYQFVVMCLDRDSGELIWQHTANETVPHEGGHPTNTFASASPVTDGKHLYVSFGSYGIYCYDLDGTPVWSRDLGDMQTRAGFGEGASPALHGDKLVVPWDHEGQSFVVALDTATGEPRWRKDRDERTSWTTPLIVEAFGKTQVILNASNRTRSYNLENGELIWECGGQVGNPIPSPVALDEVVYCMSGYRGAAVYAIRLDAEGDVTGTDAVVWSARKAAPYVPSPLLYNKRLYFTKSNNGILSIVDALNGEFLVDQKRLSDISNIYASPVGAAGRVYIVGRDGTTMVFNEGDTYEVLATNRLDEPVDASPVVVGGKLFLRGERNLYCFEQQ